jgi:dynein heavy chain
MFLDSQISDEKFQVYLNEMLSSGKIPGLFAADEIDTIYNGVRNEGKGEGIPDAKDPMFDFFISKIKRNLHVCLCFSPVGEAFRRRASRFPSLINCAVIDWFQPWPEQALYDVAKRFLNDTELGTPENKEVIIKFMPFSFAAVNKASDDYRDAKVFLGADLSVQEHARSKSEQARGQHPAPGHWPRQARSHRQRCFCLGRTGKNQVCRSGDRQGQS